MRYVLLPAGWIAVSLGVAGVFLPLMPTTPFLLLAVTCFAKSSPASRAWLLRSPMLGPVISDYLAHRVISRRARFTALAMLWPGVGWSATHLVPVPAVSIGLVLVASLVTLWLFFIPSAESPR